jgi:large subunit ribosomal protein L7Ae
VCVRLVQGKSRLGQVVHKKTASCLAVTEVPPGDQAALAQLVDAVHENYNARFETVSLPRLRRGRGWRAWGNPPPALPLQIRKTWGGGILGEKTMVKIARAERARQRELAARA